MWLKLEMVGNGEKESERLQKSLTEWETPSAAPLNLIMAKMSPRWIFKNSTWFLLLAVDNTITHPAAFSSPPSFPSHAHLISR